MKVLPAPNVEGAMIVTPSKTLPSSKDAPGPIVPPLMYCAAMTDILPPTAPFQLAPIAGWPPADDDPVAIAQTMPAVVAPPEIAPDPLAHMTPQDISDIAWDLVLFNDMDRNKILSSYELAPDAVAKLQQLPLFVAESANAKKALQADPHIGVRKLAKTYLSQRVSTLNEMAMSNMVEPNSRLKAIEQLTRIAGLDRDTGEKKQGGVAVQINFGSALGSGLAHLGDAQTFNI